MEGVVVAPDAKRPLSASVDVQSADGGSSSDSDTGISEWLRLRKQMPRTASLGYEVEMLLKRPEFQDITVKCGSREFPCSRIAMAARSEVFRAMLSGSFTETNSRTIELHGIDEAIAENLTQYIINDSCDLLSGYPNVNLGNAIALLQAADQYHIRGLMFLCQEVVWHLVTPECLMDVLSVAKDLNCPYLKAKLYKQIRKEFSADELLMKMEGTTALMPVNLELPDRTVKRVLVKPNLSVEELKQVAARESAIIDEIDRKRKAAGTEEIDAHDRPRSLRLLVRGVALKDRQQLVDAIPTSETYRSAETENDAFSSSVLNVKVHVRSPKANDNRKAKLRMLC